MYGKIYFVTFEARKYGKKFTYIYHCWAWDAKEAKELAKKAWESDHSAHQFHLYAKRSKAPTTKFLKVVSWSGDIFAGEDCFDFICTSF